MNLNDILKAHDINLPLTKVKLVRHKINNPEELKLIEKYDEAFICMQSIQRVQQRPVFGGGHLPLSEYVLSFMADRDGNTMFKGVFKIVSREKYSNEQLPENNEIKQFYQNSISTLHYWYQQIKQPLLSDYENRLIIDWGRATRAYVQNYNLQNPKEVLAIRPEGYFRNFPGYLNFSLSRNELNKLFKNADANEVWRTSLSRISAVYLILDEQTGNQYVGSAYGRGGLWARWETYNTYPAGGNLLLRELLKSDKTRVDNFRYSIIEVLPSTATKEEVIARESAVKEKFGSRVHGLNQN